MLGKSVGKRNDAQYMLFCICPHTSHIQKFWDAYMIMNGNFMVIVELCNGDLILYAKHQETFTLCALLFPTLKSGCRKTIKMRKTEGKWKQFFLSKHVLTKDMFSKTNSSNDSVN